jgi:TolA-binding protein
VDTNDTETQRTPSMDKLPDWAQQEITTLRTEITEYRTQITDLEAARDTATQAEEQRAEELETRITELESQRSALQAEQARVQLVTARGLPLTVQDKAGNRVAVTSLIVGATDDERAASADALVALVGTATSEPLSPDPAQAAAPAPDGRAELAQAFFAAAGAD